MRLKDYVKIIVGIVLLCMVMPGSVYALSGGPGGGYYFYDSDDALGPAYEWDQVKGLSDAQSADLDTFSIRGPFSIGFNFSFFGNTYNQVYISSMGFITFSDNQGAGGSRLEETLPSHYKPNNLIAGLWDSLNPGG